MPPLLRFRRLGPVDRSTLKYGVGQWVTFGQNYQGKPKRPHLGVIRAAWFDGKQNRYAVECGGWLWSVTEPSLRAL